jgi:Dihydroorotate dehydrogenase
VTVYERLRPLLFRLSPEHAHRFSQTAFKFIQETSFRRGFEAALSVSDGRFTTTVLDRQFPNPVSVAVGYNRCAEVPHRLSALGFGFVKVGGVTAQPQGGNPRPRLFCLSEDHGLITRLGLNNDGAAVVGKRVAAADTQVPIGVTLAKGEAVPLEAAAADYRQGYKAVTAGDFSGERLVPELPGVRDAPDA